MKTMEISIERYENGGCLSTDKIVIQGTPVQLGKRNMIIMSAADLLSAVEGEAEECKIK
jgi:hypothetical protein